MEKFKGMPISAPLYEFKRNEKFLYPDAKILFVSYNVEGENVKELVPAPLKIAKSPMVICFVAYYEKSVVGSSPDALTSWGSYHEAATLIEVKLKTETSRVRGWYCNSIFVDNDAAMAVGREIYGFPKKIAEIKLFDENGKKVGTVKRNGIVIMKIEVDPIKDLEELPSGEIIKAITLKHFINPECNAIELSEFIATDLVFNPKIIKMGNASIEFNKSERDLIYLLKPKTNPLGVYTNSDGILPPGKVIHKII
ncbi:MAG: acetoacetate decarboxylase family protein [Candidatus Helarchaeota archaeon]|nr:acetoacetate decarboxylase family protein [Candidatus Helarchaeota archaeon]